MKPFFLSLLILCALAQPAAPQAQTTAGPPVKVMSYNIRYGTALR